MVLRFCKHYLLARLSVYFILTHRRVLQNNLSPTGKAENAPGARDGWRRRAAEAVAGGGADPRGN